MARGVEFGIFMPVGDGGYVISTTAPPTPATFDYNRRLTVLAEELGLGFMIAQARWRGFGGKTRHWDRHLESITTMAGLAACTSRIRLFCTIQTMAFHPAVAAKMVATVDEISGGRFGLNLVAGSSPIDHGQMGIWRDLDHAQLYDVATEWITVAKRLWSEDRVDFEGTYYHLVDCMSYPKPIQRPHPPIMCAATSEGGLRFTIQHADASLVNGQDIPDLERNGLRSKALAAELGTTTRTIGLVMVVPGETDADAEARVRHYNEGADLEALSARAMEWSASAKEWSRDEELRRQRTRMFPDGRTPAAMSRNTVTGTPEHLAEKIADVIERGDFDWLAFYFPDYLADLEIFGREVLPVLVKEGIGRKDTPKPSLGSPVET